ncbi:site-specific integrase [Marinobacteraceae bacterium S3BR75-40.1]
MAAIERYVQAATRDNTRRSYRAAIEHFEVSWGGLLPATADSVARYLADHAETHSVATLRQRLAALARWHRDQGFPDPTKAPLVRSVLKGIREEHPYRPKRATPLAVAQLQQLDEWLVARIAEARRQAHERLGTWLRNRALVLLGFWRAFRSDELCRVRIDNLSIMTGAGMVLYLGRSKNDRQAQGRTYKVPALQQCCPVEACQDWLDHLQQDTGPLFRGVDRWGHIAEKALHPNSVVPLLRQLLVDAGVASAETFSSHSLRRGFATWANASGWEVKALMDYVGWKEAQTALGYIEARSPFEPALTQLPTDDTLGRPRLAAPEAPPVRALELRLALEPQRPHSRKHHRTRRVIETHCLRPLDAQNLSDVHYRIQVAAESEEALDEQLYDLIDEMHQIASDQACWIETLIKDPQSGQVWD